jgi:hypothetical protein
MERVKLEDGSAWLNPLGEEFNDLAWRLRHNHQSLGRGDLHNAAAVMQAYSMLITHPAMTLKEVQKKISMIRKAIADTPQQPVKLEGVKTWKRSQQ